MHIHPLISDTESLRALCDRLSASDFVAVDTEFMRENTFWPDLCLVQIGNSEEAAAIDPKADGIDLAPLLDDPHPLARLMAACALSREESRGAHARSDVPETDSTLDGRHTVVDSADGQF